MIKLKRLNTKKLIIYTSIILAMCLGSAFFIYKTINMGKDNIKDASNIVQFEKAMIDMSNNADNATSTDSTVKSSQPSEFNLFDSEKWKVLKRSEYRSPDKVKTGKKNIFIP
jgi:hypothetical protein